MEKDKQKWELMYEEYISSTNGIDEKIESRKQALQESKIDLVKDTKFESLKEVYNDLKRLEKIKANLEKIKNVIELKEKLRLDKEKIKQEIVARKEQFEITKDIQKLEAEMKGLEQEYDKLKAKEKSSDLSDSEKNEVKKAISENMVKRSENNKKFSEMYKKRESLKFDDKYKNKTTDELNEESLQLSINISICNSAGRALIKGMNMSNIKDMLNQKFVGQNLKAKGKEKEKLKECKKVVSSKTKEGPEQKAEQDPEQNPEQDPEQDPKQDPIKPVKVSEFDLRHPRLAKIKNFFTNIIQKVQLNKKTQDIPPVDEPPKIENPTEDKEKDPTLENNNARAEFIKYLAEYVEKGEEGIKKERREQAKAKLEENRKAAQKREAEKDEGR